MLKIFGPMSWCEKKSYSYRVAHYRAQIPFNVFSTTKTIVFKKLSIGDSFTNSTEVFSFIILGVEALKKNNRIIPKLLIEEIIYLTIFL